MFLHFRQKNVAPTLVVGLPAPYLIRGRGINPRATHSDLFGLGVTQSHEHAFLYLLREHRFSTDARTTIDRDACFNGVLYTILKLYAFQSKHERVFFAINHESGISRLPEEPCRFPFLCYRDGYWAAPTEFYRYNPG